MDPQTCMFLRQRDHTEIMAEKFTTRSVSICYNQDQSTVAVRELLGFSCCELFLLEAGSIGRGYFGKPGEGECPLLETVTKQRE
jgi:hypothetical protein